MKPLLSLFAVFALLLLARPGVAADVHGTITGPDGLPMFSVTVSLTGTTMIGSRSIYSDQLGAYRFDDLVSGDYTVHAILEGFLTQKRDVHVEACEQAIVDLQLLVGEDPVLICRNLDVDPARIDATTNSVGVVLQAPSWERLPLRRRLAALMALAPGVVRRDADGTYTVNGSPWSESQLLIYGVNASPLRSWGLADLPRYGLLEMLKITTAGNKAEIRQASAGGLDIQLARGGQWQGSFHAYAGESALDAVSDRGGARARRGGERAEQGMTLTGPLVKERVWLMAALSRERATNLALPAATHEGDEPATTTAERQDWMLDLTWAINGHNQLTLAGFGAPRHRLFPESPQNDAADGLLEGASYQAILGWQSTLSERINLDVAYAYREENQWETGWVGSDGGDTTSLVKSIDRDASRSELSLKLDTWVSDHELGAGVQICRVRASEALADAQAPVVSGPGQPAGMRTVSAFLEDVWQPMLDLHLNLGVRYDAQEILDPSGQRLHTFGGGLAPRMGFVWRDLGGRTNKLHGHWGRFYPSQPLDLLRDRHQPLGTGAPDLTLIDPRTKASYQEEYVFGFEDEIIPDWVLGVSYVDRSLHRAVKGISFDEGGHSIITHPGQELTLTNPYAEQPLAFYDANGELVTVAPGQTTTLAPDRVGYAKPERDYHGYGAHLRKRLFLDRYTFQFSYIRATTEGNDAGFDTRLDRAAAVNGSGLLPQHSKHQFSFFGTYAFEGGLSLGAACLSHSGAALEVLGHGDVGQGADTSISLLPRAAMGTLPRVTSLDLQVDYTRKLPRATSMSLYLTVFNVLDAQQATAVDAHFSSDRPDVTLSNQPWNADKPAISTGDAASDAHLYAQRYHAWLDGRFQTRDELIAYYTSYRDAEHPNGLSWNAETFGKATAYQAGRHLRLGLGLSF